NIIVGFAQFTANNLQHMVRKLPVVLNQKKQGLVRNVAQNRFVNYFCSCTGQLLAQQRPVGNYFATLCKTNDLFFSVDAGFKYFYNTPCNTKKSGEPAAFTVNYRSFFVQRTGFFIIQP